MLENGVKRSCVVFIVYLRPLYCEHEVALIVASLYLIVECQVIAAEGEMNASRKLKEAADVMSESPNSMQLRYLQTLTAISSEKNSTIIFPLPVDMISSMLKK